MNKGSILQELPKINCKVQHIRGDLIMLASTKLNILNRKRSRLESPPPQPPPKSRKRGRGDTGPRDAVDSDEEDEDPFTAATELPKGSPMKECRDILKELFSKRHTAYAWPFYKPVDTSIFRDYRYGLQLSQFDSG